MYKLYLDDIRYPDNHPDWRIARNYYDAQWYVKTYGLPYHVSFDHDLADIHYDNEHYVHNDGWLDDSMPSGELQLYMAGGRGHPYEFTGYDFAKWLCQWIMDNVDNLDNFSYNVHSANSVGAENIRRYMENFLRDRYV